MKSTAINMVSVLGTITLISALAVSGFYLLTKDAIAAADEAKLKSAIEEVIPGFDEVLSMKYCKTSDGTDSLEVYPAKKSGDIVGYAIKTYSKEGYGGEISLMVGVMKDGTINKVKVISESETPGLGHKMSTEDVLVKQVENVNPSEKKISVKKDGGDIDAITAATISSRAFCDAINRAMLVSKELLDAKVDVSSGATNVVKED